MELYHRQYGDSDQTLIILHGLLGSSANWQSLAKRFAQTYRVYSLDLRNHAQSPWSNTMNYQVMAKDVLEFINSIQANSVTLMGHSMGGKVAMQLALDYPQAINSLVVADIAPVKYKHDYSSLLNAMLNVDLAALKNRSQADDALSTQIPDTGMRAFILHNLSFTNNHWYWRPNIKVLLTKQMHILTFDTPKSKSFSNKVLFLHGQNSDYVQPKHHPVMHRYFPNLKTQSIANAGHWLHAEQPKDFYQACSNFLVA